MCFFADKVAAIAVAATIAGRRPPPIAGHADATDSSARGGESGDICEVGHAEAVER